MESNQDIFVEASARVAGLLVGPNWLKTTANLEDYRAYVHGAFERASIRYKERMQKRRPRQASAAVKEDSK